MFSLIFKQDALPGKSLPCKGKIGTWDMEKFGSKTLEIAKFFESLPSKLFAATSSNTASNFTAIVATVAVLFAH